MTPALSYLRDRHVTFPSGGAAPVTPAAGANVAAEPVVADDSGLRACPACGAPNSPRRILCGRCAADLETGELVSRPRARRAMVARPLQLGDRDRVRRRGWVVATVVTLLALGAWLATMAAAGAGPFAGDESVPRAIFEQARYPSSLDALTIDALATSSTRPATDGQSFDAGLMADDDLTTAWRSAGGVVPAAVGEVVRADFAQAVWLRRIVIGNGAQADDEAFDAHGRIDRGQVTLDGGVTLIANVLDQRGLQVITLDDPELTTAVRIEVLDVHPGASVDDVAVAELAFTGHVADDHDQRIAERRAELRSGA